ncbi:hypothetical protein [Acidicapsa ligni]|uniref:hypothetical protein n=1 Tax=Acidicapsa ligni TaxID=542300 RepID=UPI0021E0FB3B|nr:hypothetical protein [Acidicapsa ligni]
MIIKWFATFVVMAYPALAQGVYTRPTPDTSAFLEAKSNRLQGLAILSDDTTASSDPTNIGSQQQGEQTKRILYIVPNFHSVSADKQLPPESRLDKLKDATFDSFDYSSVIFAAGVAGASQAGKSYPEFHQGAAGYGRYFWHAFVDQTSENYFVEGFMPILFREDTRYYTLEHGRPLKRAYYAFSRMWTTRTDSGTPTPNFAEIVGAGAAAGIANLYYPEPQRTWTKTGQRWVTNIGFDSTTLVFKEFWPDLNRKIFHQR